MSDSKDKADAASDGLTPEERKMLARAIKQVERELLERTVRTLRNWALLALGVLTFFGFVSFSGIKETVVKQAAEHLYSDTELRKRVEQRSVDSLDTVTDVLKRARSLASELDVESARIAVGMNTQLSEIHSMIDQISNDLRKITEDGQEEVP